MAKLLAEFASAERVVRPLPDESVIADRVVDLLAAMANQNAEGRFRLRAHIANYALFLTGMFPDRVEQCRARHGRPGLAYYEDVGRVNYRKASELKLAAEYELREVFARLGHWFGRVRAGLNDLADRYLIMDRGGNLILPGRADTAS